VLHEDGGFLRHPAPLIVLLAVGVGVLTGYDGVAGGHADGSGAEKAFEYGSLSTELIQGRHIQKIMTQGKAVPPALLIGGDEQDVGSSHIMLTAPTKRHSSCGQPGRSHAWMFNKLTPRFVHSA